MRMFIAVLMSVLLSASAASAAIYIKVKGGKGTVYWDKKNISGYFKYVKKGGGNITFTDGTAAYIFEKQPNGFAFDANGKVLDNYYIYKWNPGTGMYEYRDGDKVLTQPED